MAGCAEDGGRLQGGISQEERARGKETARVGCDGVGESGVSGWEYGGLDLVRGVGDGGRGFFCACYPASWGLGGCLL